jgi:REP element-mobilizing transposase RayT
MSTYIQILYQVVFSTKYREKTLEKGNRETLYKYIAGIINNKNCKLYEIGGIEDHIHIVFQLHPSVSLSSLVKDIKIASNLYIKKNQLFKNFTGWQEGYGAFTYSIKDKERLINYVKNQEKHHGMNTYIMEYKELLNENDIDFEEKYLN